MHIDPLSRFKPPYSVDLARTLLHICARDGESLTSFSISPPRIPEKEMRDEAIATAKANADLVKDALNAYDPAREEAVQKVAAALREYVGPMDEFLIDQLERGFDLDEIDQLERNFDLDEIDRFKRATAALAEFDTFQK